MKKFSTLATAVLTLSATILSSCLKTEKMPENPAAYGYEIYVSAAPQNWLAEDATKVALRLNILLSTAKSQGLDFKDASIEGHDTEGNLMEYLFKENKITLSDEQAGIYKLVFDPHLNETNVGTNDDIRKGTLYINTRGKLLEELEVNEDWQITAEGGSYQVGLKPTSSYGTVYFEISFPNGYVINATGPSQWNIYGPGIKTQVTQDIEGNYIGTWTINYTLEYSSASMNYNSFRSSVMYQSGSAQGVPVNYTFTFNYQIQPEIMYKLSCSPVARGSGVIRVECPQLSEANPIYPSNFVKIKWKSTECSDYFYLGYDGLVYDQSGNVTTEPI